MKSWMSWTNKVDHDNLFTKTVRKRWCRFLRFSVFHFGDFAHACSRHYIMNFIKV